MPAWSARSGCDPDIKLKKKPTEYLKQIYFDSLIFTPEAIRHLAAQVGASQIVLGSDYPYPWQLHPVDHIFATTRSATTQKADILGSTAAKILEDLRVELANPPIEMEGARVSRGRRGQCAAVVLELMTPPSRIEHFTRSVKC